MARQYEATWSALCQRPGTRIVGIDYFHDREDEYTPDDLERIKALPVGGTLPLNAAEHTITRIENS